MKLTYEMIERARVQASKEGLLERWSTNDDLNKDHATIKRILLAGFGEEK